MPDHHSPAMNALTSATRSEEHTSELQSQSNLVCRLLLEKKKETPTAQPSAKWMWHPRQRLPAPVCPSRWVLVMETHRGRKLTPALTLPHVRHGLNLLLL